MPTLAGRTNYPKWNAATDSPDGAAQDEALGAHFDALIGETVATASALPASNNWVGRLIMAVDTGHQYKCVALPGTWVRLAYPVFASAAGVTAGAGGGSSAAPIFWGDLVDVTFPVGRFSVAPVVTGALEVPSGAVGAGFMIEQITATGFKFRVSRIASAPSSSFKLHWDAVQMTAATAAG